MTRIFIGGAGALGSQIAMHLALTGREFVILDDDRIEIENLATTSFFRQHVGAQKATVLGELVYRAGADSAYAIIETLRPSNVRRLFRQHAPDLVIDCFDNVDARALLCDLRVPTLHTGVSADHLGMVVWDEVYTLPQGMTRGTNPICTHHLGRPILRFTAAVAAQVVEEFLGTGRQRNLFVSETMRITEV